MSSPLAGVIDAGGLTIIDDPWLSSVMSRQVRRVTGAVDARQEQEAERALVEVLDRPGFIYARVPTDDGRTIQLLKRCGFRLVDTGVMLESSAVLGNAGAGGQVRFSRPADRPVVEAIARRGFTYSRFHRDPEIPKALADEIKAQWAGNFFLGKRGDYMVVGELDERVVGFVQLLAARDNVLIIDLIAVDPTSRGRGLAKEMIRFSSSAVAGVQIMRVGTQSANTPSLQLYQDLGFTIVSSEYVFHRHQSAS